MASMASSLTSRKLEPGTETDMSVDYVIVFRFAETGKAEATSSFRKLIETLSSVGLTTEVRNGDNHSVLVFTKVATQEHLMGEVFRSRTRDWLYGVRVAAPDKDTEVSLEKDPLYPAERLRIIYQLIVNRREEGGAGITPKKGDWTNVESIFPLHDHKFNKEWIESWASSYTLNVDDLDKIRDKFGEKVAFYFAFTQSYFTALIGNAAFGVAAWILLGNFSPVYGLINSLLCVGFVEFWRFQEKELAIRWGVQGVSSIETKRHDFVGEKQIKDPITGETTQFFSSPKRLQRQLLVVPFAVAAALALGALISISFGIEIFITEIYGGPFKSVLTFIPTGIITTLQPVILSVLTDMAERQTKYENYETTNGYETAYTQKIFVLNFITSYLPIILTAFIYVPFAEHLAPYLTIFSLTVRPFAENEKQLSAPSIFHINPQRLKNQMIYFTVTNQIVQKVMGVAMPYVKVKGFAWYKQYKSKRAAKRGGSIPESVSTYDAPEEKAFLNRVRTEAGLAEYDVTEDFREMVVQYGYLALFSTIWPVTALSFLANNWLELRADAVKICAESQRPNPERADGIGPWLDTLEFLTWFGSVTTAAIAYLFSNGGIGPDGSPRNLRLWALLLTIFISEHAYFLVRLAARTFVSRLDSPGRQKERAEKYQVRKRYLEESMGRQAARMAPQNRREEINRSMLENEARQSQLSHETTEARFWKRQTGVQETIQSGSRLIEMAAAPESKKRQ